MGSPYPAICETLVRAQPCDPRPAGLLMDVSTRAVLTSAAAALVAVAAFLGELPLAGAALVLGLVFAAGWPRLLGLPSPLGAGVVVALGAAGAIMAVTLTRGAPFLRDLPLVLALAVLLAFVNELARQDGRRRLVESVTGTVTGLLVVTAAAGWVASGRTPGGTSLVVAGAVALAVGAAVSAVPLGGWTGAGITTLASVLAGGSVGWVMPNLGLVPGLVLGLATGVLLAALHVLFDGVRALESRWASGAAIVLPVAVSGIIVYVVGRVLVG